jgi:hypothetical protein
MLTTAGNINKAYETLGVIHAVVVRPAKDAGCSGEGACQSRKRSTRS